MLRKIAVLFCAAVLMCAVGCTQESNTHQKTGSEDQAAQSVATQDPTLASTKSGQVKGSEEGDVVVFKGIPFAKPPIDDLRFAPTQPVDSWEGVLECANFKPMPAQLSSDAGASMSEDCLYLNVWAPKEALENPEKKLPVLVFIHGGAFAFGSSSDSKFDGTAFAEDGVICVTVEYRLNALGFFASEEMRKESGYVGNLGLLDQIESLKWINANIGSFGGDSENITISGESAGSMSVSSLIMSPLTKDLFQKAIMESGTLFGQPLISPAGGNLDTGLAIGQALQESLGASNLTDLRELDVQQLVEKSAFSADVTSPLPLSCMPVLDGKVVYENPYESLKKGEYADVKILMGYNSDEGTMFVPEGISEEAYINFLHINFGEKAPAVLERFPVDADHSATDRARQIVKQAFQMGCSVFGDTMSAQESDVYVYNFDYEVAALDEKGLGTMHGLELLFAFDSFPKDMEIPASTRVVVDQVHDYWVSFVKSGNPNSDSASVEWPKYTKDNKEMLKIAESSKATLLEDVEDSAFFAELIWGK